LQGDIDIADTKGDDRMEVDEAESKQAVRSNISRHAF
jgi:hypothetical protein